MTTKHLAAPLEIKELGANGFVAGYASVFNAVDAQRETVAKGAFGRSLTQWQKAARKPAMLWMHDAAKPVGVWENLREDSSGLAVEGKLAIRTQSGADAYELLKMGAVTGLSIGYRTLQSRVDAKSRVRTLTDVDLFEVSLVTFPANEFARIHSVKSPTVFADDEVRAIVERLNAMARLFRS
ncbi:MAG TPA: HK97 family phage prohead protease [Alphaproteobacteria bacterium]|nr:HK97 family phage prohead protease [Alphaproteobacteria bacterium]